MTGPFEIRRLATDTYRVVDRDGNSHDFKGYEAAIEAIVAHYDDKNRDNEPNRPAHISVLLPKPLYGCEAPSFDFCECGYESWDYVCLPPEDLRWVEALTDWGKDWKWKGGWFCDNCMDEIAYQKQGKLTAWTLADELRWRDRKGTDVN